MSDKVQIWCNQNELADKLDLVSRAVGAVHPYDGVLLIADGDGLCLQATNGDYWLNVRMAADVVAPGSIAVQANPLVGTVRHLAPGQVAIEADPVTLELTVRQERYDAAFVGRPAADFPHEALDGVPLCSVGAKDMLRIISKTVFATTKKSSALSGVCLNCRADRLIAVATDGYRMSIVTVPVRLAPSVGTSVVVPGGVLSELRHIIDKAEDETVEVLVSAGREMVGFRTGGITMMARAISDDYPDYKKVMPSGYDTSVIVSRDDLNRALRVAHHISNDSLNGVWLEVGADNIGVVAYRDADKHTGRIKAQVEGNPMTIVISVKYMLDALKALDGKQITIRLRKDGGPAGFQAESDDGFVHLIMPMRRR